MTRLKRNRQAAALIVARIERSMELSAICRASQLIKTGQFNKQTLQSLIADLKFNKQTLQSLIADLKPKKETQHD